MDGSWSGRSQCGSAVLWPEVEQSVVCHREGEGPPTPRICSCRAENDHLVARVDSWLVIVQAYCVPACLPARHITRPDTLTESCMSWVMHDPWLSGGETRQSVPEGSPRPAKPRRGALWEAGLYIPAGGRGRVPAVLGSHCVVA